MMSKHWLAGTILALAGVNALAQTGLKIDTDLPLSGWQTRIGLTTTTRTLQATESLHLRGARVLGDYYFNGPAALGNSRVTGGFRATSGLLLGVRGAGLATPALTQPGFGLSVSRQMLPFTMVPGDVADSTQTLPYVGLGYTGLSLRGGWSFSADLGLMATSPGAGLRFGRVLGGGQNLDDLVRDLRLRPVLQLGVSYSF
jgi:hypothetical protein